VTSTAGHGRTNPAEATSLCSKPVNVAQVCPAALDQYKPNEMFRVFIWAGPVPTEKITKRGLPEDAWRFVERLSLG